ncbi:MAG: glycosyltransferase [Proteobacteria bacterium]|nr:glycosyltransferase [Pseudomonadota bacterium]
MIWLLPAPALLALGMTAANLMWWPRGRPGGNTPKVSLLMPARNEEASIETAVRAALDALPADGELVVGDDASTDRTAEILAEIAAEDARLRVITPPALPEGWVGKPHNCHHLAAAARGDVLVFVDADVTLASDALDRLSDLADRYDAGVVSAFPSQETQTAAEAHLMPLLALTYTAWLPMPLVWWSRDPRFLAANGQVLWIDAEAYRVIGGFEAVGSEVVDDMAICRRAKQLGQRVVFADGKDIASCRMYGSGSELWRGFTKNLYEGLGENPALLVAVMTLYCWAFVLPWIVVALTATTGGPWLLAGAIGVGANVTTRGLLAWSRGHRLSGLVTHPGAVLALLALAVSSARETRAGRVTWAGRVYRRRKDRRTA